MHVSRAQAGYLAIMNLVQSPVQSRIPSVNKKKMSAEASSSSAAVQQVRPIEEEHAQADHATSRSTPQVNTGGNLDLLPFLIPGPDSSAKGTDILQVEEASQYVYLSRPLLQKNCPNELSKDDQLDQRLKLKCVELEEKRAKVCELEATVSTLEDQLKSKTEDVDCLVKEKEELGSKVDSLESKTNRLEEAKRKLEEENKNLENKIKERDELVSDLRESRKQLEARQMEGIVITLTSIFHKAKGQVEYCTWISSTIPGGSTWCC